MLRGQSSTFPVHSMMSGRSCWSWLDTEDAHLVTEITSDGRIALGLWRQRKMAAHPTAAPTLSGRDRQIVALAAEAIRMGYAICPLPDGPGRAEARRLRREGWIERGGAWLANYARGMVPTPMAEVEVAPERADVA